MKMEILDKVATGQNIKRICHNKNIKPGILMKYLSIASVQSIYKWFEGVNVPTVDNLVMLSCILDVTIDELIVKQVINST